MDDCTYYMLGFLFHCNLSLTSVTTNIEYLTFAEEIQLEKDLAASPASSSTRSNLEAELYYYGLPSEPILVARTGTGTFDVYRPKKKFLRAVGDHPLIAVWEDKLALQTNNILGSKGVKCTSIEIIRIGCVGEPASVVVWIGVKHNTLSRKDGLAVAKECKRLLVASEIFDVEVEIHESVPRICVDHLLSRCSRILY